MINVCVKKNDMYSSEEILSIAQQVFSNELTGIAAVSAQLNESFVQAIAILQHCTGKIIVSGIGKSGHVAQKIAATLSSTGTPSFFLHPAEALHGDLGVISPTDVVIAISYSGESAELLAMMPIIKRHNIEIIAITANIYSALANYANTTIPITIAKEACPLNLAPTTSTTATMVLGDAIAITLLTVKGFKATDFALSHPGGQLGRRLLTRVSDIMHTGKTIPLLSITASFQEVICEISTKLLGILLLTNDNGSLAGVISDGDIRRMLQTTPPTQWHTITAAQMMTKRPHTILHTDLAFSAVALLEQWKISSLVALDEQQKIVGVFNIHDLFQAKLI